MRIIYFAILVSLFTIITSCKKGDGMGEDPSIEFAKAVNGQWEFDKYVYRKFDDQGKLLKIDTIYEVGMQNYADIVTYSSNFVFSEIYTRYGETQSGTFTINSRLIVHNYNPTTKREVKYQKNNEYLVYNHEFAFNEGSQARTSKIDVYYTK